MAFHNITATTSILAGVFNIEIGSRDWQTLHYGTDATKSPIKTGNSIVDHVDDGGENGGDFVLVDCPERGCSPNRGRARLLGKPS